MIDHLCDVAANNPTAAWACFLGFFVVIIAVFAWWCWPSELRDPNDPNDFGC